MTIKRTEQGAQCTFWRECTMRIVILGSWTEKNRDEDRLEGTAEEFAAACRELGGAIARLGQVVIAGGRSPDTADYHVVRGVVETAVAMGIKDHRVEIIRPV